MGSTSLRLRLFSRGGGTIGWPRLWRALALWAAVTASLCLVILRSPLQSPLEGSVESCDIPVIGKGVFFDHADELRVRLPKRLPETTWITVRLRPILIDQVWFRVSTDGASADVKLKNAELLSRDAGDIELYVQFTEDRMLVQRRSADWVGQVELPPGPITKIGILSWNSNFVVKEFLVVDRLTGRVQDTMDSSFVTNLRTVVLAAALPVAIMLLLLWLLEAKVWRRWFGPPALTTPGFAAACMVLIVGHVLFPPGTTVRGVPLLWGGVLLWRLVGSQKIQARLPAAFWWLWPLLSMSLIAVAFGWRPWALRESLTFLPFAAAALVVAVTVLESGGRAAMRDAPRAAGAAAPFVFCLLAAGLLWADADRTHAALLASLALTLTAAGKFVTAWRTRRERSVAGWWLLLWTLIGLTGAELIFQRASYAQRWDQAGLGGYFRPMETLFWAPRDLFDSPIDFDRWGEVQPANLRLRSGPATKEKPPGVYRVVITGGSNTYGLGLPDVDDTWGAKLQKLLAKRLSGRAVELLNIGVIGFDSFKLMVLHSHYLQDLQYDLLVIYLNLNDTSTYGAVGPYTLRELWENQTGGKLVLPPAGESAVRRTWIAKTQSFLRRFMSYRLLKHHVLKLRHHAVVRESPRLGMGRILPIADYEKNLEQLIALARQRGADVLLATEFIEPTGETDADLLRPWLPLFEAAMRRVADRTATPLCPTNERMRQTGVPPKAYLIPADPSHLNADGTTALAGLIFDCLQTNGLLPQAPAPSIPE